MIPVLRTGPELRPSPVEERMTPVLRTGPEKQIGLLTFSSSCLLPQTNVAYTDISQIAHGFARADCTVVIAPAI
jgi:hypothetical protein